MDISDRREDGIKKKSLIPFFVADRPASLLILKGVMLKHPDVEVGIMTHALTTKNFIERFNKFPYKLDLRYEDNHFLDKEDILAKNLIKIADSGVFTRTGCTIAYNELFERYNRLGVKFGVIIDVLKDSKETIQSAMKGLRIYTKNKDKYHFKLIAVAQGKTQDEYLKCYEKLQQQFEYVAVGGLLKKWENSARWVKVQDVQFMYNVLTAIKRDYSPEWLFPLGCYHPSRHKKFEDIGVWGSDYKGWIFNYVSKIDSLMSLNKNLTPFDLSNGFTNDFKNLLKHTEVLERESVNLRKEWKGEKDPSVKSKLQINIKQKKIELEKIYAILLKERQHLARYNHLPARYAEDLNNFEKIVAMGDQEWRFRRVREYIENKVYAKL
jgi:hypothetical protein